MVEKNKKYALFRLFGICGVCFIPFTCSAFIMAIIAILFKRLQLWAVCTFFFNGYEGDETKNTEQKGSRRQKERKRGTRHNQNACRMVSHPKHTHTPLELCAVYDVAFSLRDQWNTQYAINEYIQHAHSHYDLDQHNSTCYTHYRSAERCSCVCAEQSCFIYRV